MIITLCARYILADFPEPFQDALGLSDAIGYLFIRNKENGMDGVFFVKTA
ncbi:MULTISPECIES: hypothetical protein [unclassified Xenorhabdus]|nr:MULTISPECIES: hypothetical protein [unclassified Xenorhabdus]PHM51973.1 hypothetical protein Xekk_03401 [Xenorhabdus sp. KK7.4]